MDKISGKEEEDLKRKLAKIKPKDLVAQATKDEAMIQAETDKLLNLSKRMLRIHVAHKDTDEDIVLARPLLQHELTAVFSKLATLCPDFVLNPQAIVPADKFDEFMDLIDSTIELCAGIKKDTLSCEVILPLRKAIFRGIIMGSSYTAEELAELQKFLQQQRGADVGPPM